MSQAMGGAEIRIGTWGSREVQRALETAFARGYASEEGSSRAERHRPMDTYTMEGLSAAVATVARN